MQMQMICINLVPCIFLTGSSMSKLRPSLPALPPLAVDQGRLGQLLANLLANALTHGPGDMPVRVMARATSTDFELTVSNGGPAIEPALLPHLFEPFFRGRTKGRSEGLGLGLFIAQQIASAHGGTLEVTSVPGDTCFCFRMPRGA